MPDLLIQFHATPSELSAFVSQSVQDFDLSVTAMTFFPFRGEEVAHELIPQLFAEGSPVAELALTLERPVLRVRNQIEFFETNPDRLSVRIGRRIERGLEQSSISARTGNKLAFSAWKEIAKRLKSMTQAGAVAINPEDGATAKNRDHRFTKGAKGLELGGVPILPVAGGCLLRLGDWPGKQARKAGNGREPR